MDNSMRSRNRRATPVAAIPLAAILALAGCQAYERVPIDLAAHRAALAARAIETDPLLLFVERLRSAGETVPERFDTADGLTVAEGEVFALFYNPDLRLARLEAGVTLATQGTAGAWEDPRFGFDGAEILSPGGQFQFGFRLDLTIPVSGRLEAEKARAGAAHETELRRIADREWSLRVRVRLAWAAWSVESERAALLREAVGRVERIEAVAARLEAAGELTRAEARLIRAEAVSSRARLAAAERDAETARLDLLRILGLPPGAAIELHPAMACEAVDGDAAEAGALIAGNTELAVLRAAYQVAEEALRLEIRKQFPDIVVGSGYGSEEGDDRLLLGLSIPVPVFNANRAGIAEARARREVARAAVETAFERLEHELVMAKSRLAAARSQRAALETDLVPMLDEQAGELERLAGLGQVDALVLLETATRRFEAKSTLLDLRLQEIQAAGGIRRLLGPPVRPASGDAGAHVHGPGFRGENDSAMEDSR